MSEMVDTVAKAICSKRLGNQCAMRHFTPYKGEPHPELSCGCGYLDDMFGYARAAIAAMREPARDMTVAGEDFGDDGRNTMAAGIWRAMIDAALK